LFRNWLDKERDRKERKERKVEARNKTREEKQEE
jgi:hypothetical protein